eukprot:TRINITY_DN518_c0_g1_i6.p2 TRINITY_DN518_c0_g1~~TRINITY_DN518_c0_g1_i6.p2  ORF type:complete len:544 (+),score=58.06 TRINITY_DN518_c0_g1_i6:186-1817(+)
MTKNVTNETARLLGDHSPESNRRPNTGKAPASPPIEEGPTGETPGSSPPTGPAPAGSSAAVDPAAAEDQAAKRDPTGGTLGLSPSTESRQETVNSIHDKIIELKDNTTAATVYQALSDLLDLLKVMCDSFPSQARTPRPKTSDKWFKFAEVADLFDVIYDAGKKVLDLHGKKTARKLMVLREEVHPEIVAKIADIVEHLYPLYLDFPDNNDGEPAGHPKNYFSEKLASVLTLIADELGRFRRKSNKLNVFADAIKHHVDGLGLRYHTPRLQRAHGMSREEAQVTTETSCRARSQIMVLRSHLRSNGIEIGGDLIQAARAVTLQLPGNRTIPLTVSARFSKLGMPTIGESEIALREDSRKLEDARVAYVERVQKEKEEEKDKLRAKHDKDLRELRAEHDEKTEKAQAKHDNEKGELRAEHDEKTEKAQAKHESILKKIGTLEAENKSLQDQVAKQKSKGDVHQGKLEAANREILRLRQAVLVVSMGNDHRMGMHNSSDLLANGQSLADFVANTASLSDEVRNFVVGLVTPERTGRPEARRTPTP